MTSHAAKHFVPTEIASTKVDLLMTSTFGLKNLRIRNLRSRSSAMLSRPSAKTGNAKEKD